MGIHNFKKYNKSLVMINFKQNFMSNNNKQIYNTVDS